MPQEIVGNTYLLFFAMQKTKRQGFKPSLMKKQMFKVVYEEQNRRLIEYAEDKIQEIGNSIKTFHSRNGMDRTGNLLDSLCWGVSYENKLIKSGFYRTATASGTSYLHEWFHGDVKYLIPVNGHELAETYIQKYGQNGTKGWRVFFAILAPYWGYWEKGFTLKSNYGNKTQFVQFAVMTQYYDTIKADLKPARVRFRVSVPKYDIAKLEKRWERYARI